MTLLLFPGPWLEFLFGFIFETDSRRIINSLTQILKTYQILQPDITKLDTFILIYSLKVFAYQQFLEFMLETFEIFVSQGYDLMAN